MPTGHISEYDFPCGTPRLLGEQQFPLTRGGRDGENECLMHVKFALLSDYAIIARDGKLSVIGIFDEINLPQMPGVMPAPMYLVVSLTGEPSEIGSSFDLELLLWDPDGNELFASQTDFTFEKPQAGAYPAHNTVIGLHGLRFNRAGDHSLIVKVKGEERTRVPIRVRHVQPSPPPADQPS